MENRPPDLVIYETYYKRLTDGLEIGGKVYPGINWLFILIPVLILGALFIVWMYLKDTRSIRWYFAVPLGLMRATVYGLIAYMFLLHTSKETKIWKPETPPELVRNSRLLLVLDTSESMAAHTDDPSTVPNRKTRLQRVVEYLSDENVDFMKKLTENNPVYVYRFATNLDRDDVHAFKAEKTPDGKGVARVVPFSSVRNKKVAGIETQVALAPWTTEDWKFFATYTDFKPWVLKGLSEEGAKAVRGEFAYDGGNGHWAVNYLKATDDAIIGRLKLVESDERALRRNLEEARNRLARPNAVNAGDVDYKAKLLENLSDEGRKLLTADFPLEAAGIEWAESFLATTVPNLSKLKLSDDDAARLKANVEGMRKRIDTARTITQGTNLADSVQAAFDAEKDNMLFGIVVFSDGHSNSSAGAAKADLKLNPALDNLHRAAKKERVPIITVGIGEHRDVKLVRITDLQTPDQTPPDDAFKIIVEVDGEHMKGESVDVELELFPPDSETPITLPAGKVTFDASEPPHGQFEWTINPPDIYKLLSEAQQKKAAGDKEIPEGIWKARAQTAKVSEEGKPDPKVKVASELMPIRVERKSVRVLVMASVANRDFQFLVNQLIRDKAEVSVYLQNDAGQFLDNKSITYLDDKHRHLPKFPDRLKVEDDPSEPPETKWLNLAKYDVIIAFDPDWTLLTEEQARNLRAWVDLYAGGLLHVAGSINTKKLTFNDDSELRRRLEPLLEVFPVMLGDNVLSKPRQERNVPRRLEFPGASPEMEFLRLDDDKPEDLLSGWEPFFTGKPTREAGLTSELKRGFFDYYPVKGVKDGATIVARYTEPQASENTFDKKDPPYIVTYKYGQGMTAFLGSSEMWRFRQFKDVFFERFWVKMSRFMASGSRKKQNRRGRVLMSREFVAGDTFRSMVQLLDVNLKPLPTSARPKFILRPIELDVYPDMAGARKDGKGPEGDQDKVAKMRADYLKQWTIELERTPREVKDTVSEGYFPVRRTLKAVELEDGRILQVEDERLKLSNVQKMVKGLPKDFPTGVWRFEAPVPDSSESLSVKFVIRKALPPELADVKPDLVSLAAISSEVEEVRQHMTNRSRQAEFNGLRDRAFSDPRVEGRRLAFRFADKEALALIPSAFNWDAQRIENPQTEPEIRQVKIEPLWFSGPQAPTWMTSWYDRAMGRSEQTHTIAVFMLLCIGLLSLEWLSRKLLKLA